MPVLNCVRCTCSLIYYALSLNTGILSGNIYLNTFFCGAVEALGYVSGFFFVQNRHLGRRLTGLLSLLGAGLASFICIPMILLGKPRVLLACVDVAFGPAQIAIIINDLLHSVDFYNYANCEMWTRGIFEKATCRSSPISRTLPML